jgi:hypothetical protein
MEGFGQLSTALGSIGNSIFFTIAGYFSVKSFKPQRILKIFLPAWFYAVCYFVILLLIPSLQIFTPVPLSNAGRTLNYFVTGGVWFPTGYAGLYLIGHLMVLLYQRLAYPLKILLTIILIPLSNFIYYQLCIPLVQNLFHIQLGGQVNFFDCILLSTTFIGCFVAGILAFRIQGRIQICIAITVIFSAIALILLNWIPYTWSCQFLAITLFGVILNCSFSNKTVNFVAKYVYDIYLIHWISLALFTAYFGYQANSLLGWTTQSTLGLILYPLLILIITFGIGIGMGIFRTWLFEQVKILGHRIFAVRSTN